jgi:hypothetical protein
VPQGKKDRPTEIVALKRSCFCPWISGFVVENSGKPTLFQKGLSSFYQLYFDAGGKNMIGWRHWMLGMALVNGL